SYLLAMGLRPLRKSLQTQGGLRCLICRALSWPWQGRIIAPLRRRSNQMNRAIITLLGLGLLTPMGLGAAKYSDIYQSDNVRLAKTPRIDNAAAPDDPNDPNAKPPKGKKGAETPPPSVRQPDNQPTKNTS